jgi:branched-chain amino acid transport system substrate-binding protein
VGAIAARLIETAEWRLAFLRRGNFAGFTSDDNPHTGDNTMKLTRRLLLACTAFIALAFSPAARAEDTIKIGGLATLEGPLAVPGQDGMRGIKMAIAEVDGAINGKKIVLVTGSSNGDPDVAIRAARKLVEQDKVPVLIGPLSGSEGIAMRDYAKTQPDTTFVNGSSAASETTLFEPAPNFFRFSTDGAQWMAGLGDYAYKTKGFKKVAVIAEDYSFPYTQVQGFMIGFCRAGGHVVQKAWAPLGTRDYSSIIAALPAGIDALYVALGGSDAINFLTQYEQAGGDAPLIGASITMDQTVLGVKGKQRNSVIGTASAGPIADNWDDPRWKKFVADYQKQFPDGLPSPSLFAHAYYVNAKAVMLGLQAVGGDVSDGGAKLRAALSTLSFDTPTGPVKLDANRQGIASIFVTEVAEAPDGHLYKKVVTVAGSVNQTLGEDPVAFKAKGVPSRTSPACP